MFIANYIILSIFIKTIIKCTQAEKTSRIPRLANENYKRSLSEVGEDSNKYLSGSENNSGSNSLSDSNESLFLPRGSKILSKPFISNSNIKTIIVDGQSFVYNINRFPGSTVNNLCKYRTGTFSEPCLVPKKYESNPNSSIKIFKKINNKLEATSVSVKLNQTDNNVKSILKENELDESKSKKFKELNKNAECLEFNESINNEQENKSVNEHFKIPEIISINPNSSDEVNLGMADLSNIRTTEDETFDFHRIKNNCSYNKVNGNNCSPLESNQINNNFVNKKSKVAKEILYNHNIPPIIEEDEYDESTSENFLELNKNTGCLEFNESINNEQENENVNEHYNISDIISTNPNSSDIVGAGITNLSDVSTIEYGTLDLHRIKINSSSNKVFECECRKFKSDQIDNGINNKIIKVEEEILCDQLNTESSSSSNPTVKSIIEKFEKIAIENGNSSILYSNEDEDEDH